ncbi:hypothetical protein YC2023_099594 [Brassica napus]
MAAMRCESKRIWCRDYINGKGTLHLRNWLWIKYYNQIVEDRLLVFVFLLKQLLRLESKVSSKFLFCNFVYLELPDTYGPINIRVNYVEPFLIRLKLRITLRLVDWISLPPNELESTNDQGMWIEW